MVLISRMQLDERMRQEMLWREARQARMVEEATGGTVKAAGSPRVLSQFFLQRLRESIGRLK